MPVENLLVVNVLPEDDPATQAAIQALKHREKAGLQRKIGCTTS